MSRYFWHGKREPTGKEQATICMLRIRLSKPWNTKVTWKTIAILVPKYYTKVKLHSWQSPNILSEIMRLLENGGRGRNPAQISNWHLYMGKAAQCIAILVGAQARVHQFPFLLLATTSVNFVHKFNPPFKLVDREEETCSNYDIFSFERRNRNSIEKFW